MPKHSAKPVVCKTCSHGVDYHAVGKFAKMISYFLTGTYSKCMVGPWCKCVKFVPNDNLRYLEWAYGNDKR